MRLKKLSLLLALTLLVSVSALPVTAHAGGSKDTTPPTLTASMEGDALKIESSDDLSGVEAVFVDENRINSLTDGKASVALKDYAGTEKQVSISGRSPKGIRQMVVHFSRQDLLHWDHWVPIWERQQPILQRGQLRRFLS